jgi:hypothetical protein
MSDDPDEDEKWITTPQMLILVCLAGVIMWAYAVKWIMAWLS